MNLKLVLVKSFFVSSKIQWVLKPGEYTIGRIPTNDIVIVDPYISRRHAKVFYRDGRWFIEDLGSTNGTVVDGEPIEAGKPRELRNGSEILLGLTVLKAVLEESGGE